MESVLKAVPISTRLASVGGICKVFLTSQGLSAQDYVLRMKDAGLGVDQHTEEYILRKAFTPTVGLEYEIHLLEGWSTILPPQSSTYWVCETAKHLGLHGICMEAALLLNDWVRENDACFRNLSKTQDLFLMIDALESENGVFTPLWTTFSNHWSKGDPSISTRGPLDRNDRSGRFTYGAFAFLRQGVQRGCNSRGFVSELEC